MQDGPRKTAASKAREATQPESEDSDSRDLIARLILDPLAWAVVHRNWELLLKSRLTWADVEDLSTEADPRGELAQMMKFILDSSADQMRDIRLLAVAVMGSRMCRL